MANLPETPTYTGGIYQLEIVDPVLGGAAGISNTQAQQIANRTAYLKSHMDTAETNITALTTGLADKAPLASPALTGTPTAPTAAGGTNTTQIATTAFVAAAIPNVSIYAPLASPALTGTPTAPTAAPGTNTTQLATTAFVTAADTALSSTLTTAINLKANIASPALTGVPTAPTAAPGTNTTQLATTAFVTDADAVVSAAKWTKAGDQASGAHGINDVPVAKTGLVVQSDDPDNGWSIRMRGDAQIKPAATQTIDQPMLYFANKAGSYATSIGLQTMNETMRFWNNAGANVAVIDANGNYIGGNLEVSGTFTPTVRGTTVAGTATYTTAVGEYAICGNMVHYTIDIQWSGATGTGGLTLAGLPFPVAGGSSLVWWTTSSIWMGSGAAANGVYAGMAQAGSSFITMFVRTVTGTGGFGGMPMAAAGNMIVSGSYRFR